jgi:hypothetical protein
MNLTKLWRSARLGLAALALAACASEPTGPAYTPAQASPALVRGLIGDVLELKGLTRNKPLPADITVSAVIGADGGTISIPDAGFTLSVPKGAVKGDTKFSVTAVRGRVIAYEFEPHGIVFQSGNTSPTATQDLSATNWNVLKQLKAGYFTDRSQLTNPVAVKIAETISGITSVLSQKFTWTIPHFSGYTIGWDE